MNKPPSNPPIPIKTRKYLRLLLSTLAIVLAILTAAIPATLNILRRADAQVALGNAKALRMALQVAGTECYAAGLQFFDETREGGVTEEVWKNVLMDSKVPGDFWVLEMDEKGYEVLRFAYQEGDFMVLYCKEPLTYQVYYQQAYIETRYPEGGAF